MAEYIGGIIKAAASSITAGAASSDDDFAEFASVAPTAASAVAEASAAAFSPIVPHAHLPVGLGSPWYAVWERHSLSEFKTEGYILLLLAAVVLVHLWGSKRNRNIAKGFIASIAPVLTKEFALVGFTRTGAANTVPNDEFDLDASVKPITHTEFVSYASGRQNIAFVHTSIRLQARNNPIMWAMEYFLAFFMDSIPTPADIITFTMSPFDGSEPGKATGNSKYDSFVWALVNKRQMRRVREERYDLSLTRTSDWEGLPSWLAVMGESKEVGDMCLYKELKEVVQECGDFLEYLAVTDMPKEKPTRLEEFTPRKRLILELTLPSASTSPELVQRLISAYIRLVDHLVANAHFRPEVLRKIKATREEESRKLKRHLDEETKEERETKLAEKKKNERDARLRKMTAAEQKKFLEKEREKERKDAMKKQSRKG